MLPVIVVASLVALLCGIAHFVLRALHLRRIQTAEAYQAACREAVQLLRRYAPKSGGKDRQFDLTQVPLELRQTLLDGLQILAAHAHQQPDEESLPASLAGPLQELQSSLEVVRAIADGKVAEAGRVALRALFVDAAFGELQSALRALDRASAAPGCQTANLAEAVPAARSALAWKQDGLTVSHEQFSKLLGDAEQRLTEQIPNHEQNPDPDHPPAEDRRPNDERAPIDPRGSTDDQEPEPR